MLLGTEGKKAPDFRVVGFIQPSYTHHDGTELSGLLGGAAVRNGLRIGENLVGPNLGDDTNFHLRRAKIGVRGRLNDKIDYLAMVDAGQNAINFDPFDDRQRPLSISDISMTFKHIKGAKVRIGLFKNPVAEEIAPNGANFDYIEPSDFGRRVLMERFATGGRKPAGSPLAAAMGTETPTGYGFSGFRDWGVQVFDTFKRDKWHLSYALKVGRGESIYDGDDHFHPELYLYGSAEYNLPGGKGPSKNGIKLFAWRQQGEREFETDATDTEYDRVRYGLGFRARGAIGESRYQHRLAAELMYADGMLFASPAGNVPGGNLQFATDRGNKARGWYIDYGFYLNQHWDFGIRYDQDDFLYDQHSTINPGNERRLETWTLGVNYRFNPKVKLAMNYSFKDANAPEDYIAMGGFTAGQAATTTLNSRNTVKTLDDRLSLELTWRF